MAKPTDTPRSPRTAPHLIVPAMLTWFAANARDLPWRRTSDPYAIWVSEIMLQQTQVKTVVPYWQRWLRELPTIESLAAAKPERIHKLWEGLGYYTRVRNMQKAAQQILAEHGGKFPAQFDAILALPGIGRYTAGAIASIAFNQPVPILDGNVIRVLARLHSISEDPQEKKTNARLWQLAEEFVRTAAGITPPPTQNAFPPCSALNQSLMELGALICTPRTPHCAACPVAKHCTALHENRVAELPRPKQRAKVTARRFLVFIFEREGKFLVSQRTAGVVNAHLWEFPNIEILTMKSRTRHSVRAAVLTWLHGTRRAHATRPAEDFQVNTSKPFCVVKHSITRYRMTVEAYRIAFDTKYPKLPGAWRTLEQLHKLPFTSAHRQLATRLEKSRDAA